nr:MAG TPA: hypothetical protein [Caudoviricetes sp.]
MTPSFFIAWVQIPSFCYERVKKGGFYGSDMDATT